MKNLSEGNIYKNFILFALPLIGAGLFSQFYSVFDTIIAGKFLGEEGLGAIGATADFLVFIRSPFWGYAGGFAVYIATLFGARDYQKMKKVLEMNVLIMAAAALLIGVFCVIFIDPIFDLLNVDPTIEGEAKIYFTICVLGHFFVVMPHCLMCMMSALGVTGFPFLMSLLAGALNILGNLVSVVIFDFGVTGIAWATVLAGACVVICYLFKFRVCLKELSIPKEKFSFDSFLLHHSFRYALPNTLQQMAMYFAGMAISPVVNGFGASATAGYSVTQRIFDITASIYQNSARSLLNYGAQCVGGGKISLLKRGWRAGLLQASVLVTPVLLSFILFARPICAVFFPTGFHGVALDYAIFFCRACVPFVYMNLLDNLYHARFRGIGAMNVNLTTTIFASVVRVLCGALLAIPYGMKGVYFGMAISWGAEFLLCFIIDRVRFNTDEKIIRFLVRKGTLSESVLQKSSK